jgi:hypothetical protein
VLEKAAVLAAPAGLGLQSDLQCGGACIGVDRSYYNKKKSQPFEAQNLLLKNPSHLTESGTMVAGSIPR